MSASGPLASLPACVAGAADCRCLCGSLLARMVEGGVELKCRRCRRTLVLPLRAAGPGARRPTVRAIPIGEAE